MSAEPKSLASLASVTVRTRTKKSNELENVSSDSSGPSGGQDGQDRPYGKHRSFRASDEFVAGLAAAFVNTTLLFPINKLIFRQMAGGHGTQKAADQMKEEGMRYLYRGILPPLIQKMVSVSIMFGSFGHYKKWVDANCASHPVVNLALTACLTGTTEAILTPLERVQMLLQDRKFHNEYRNTIDALVKLRKFGCAEYYRGLTCVLLRNGPSNILFFGLRDEIKKFLPKGSDTLGSSTNSQILNTKALLILSQQHQHQRYQADIVTGQSNAIKQGDQRHRDSMLHNFLSGAILGMFISTLFYPLSVVRTRMQTRAPGTEFLSIGRAFSDVYCERDRKFARLFHGCLINVMRQFISWGIINCSYEFVLDLLHQIE